MQNYAKKSKIKKNYIYDIVLAFLIILMLDQSEKSVEAYGLKWNSMHHYRYLRKRMQSTRKVPETYSEYGVNTKKYDIPSPFPPTIESCQIEAQKPFFYSM